MPTVDHLHGRACNRELLSLWDRFFIPLTSIDFERSGSPFLGWSVYFYFSLIVVPQIECSRLRNWMMVYLANPAFNRRQRMLGGAVLIGRIAEDLNTWYNQGLLTTRWFSAGAPGLIELAAARGVILDRMN